MKHDKTDFQKRKKIREKQTGANYSVSCTGRPFSSMQYSRCRTGVSLRPRPSTLKLQFRHIHGCSDLKASSLVFISYSQTAKAVCQILFQGQNKTVDREHHHTLRHQVFKNLLCFQRERVCRTCMIFPCQSLKFRKKTKSVARLASSCLLPSCTLQPFCQIQHKHESCLGSVSGLEGGGLILSPRSIHAGEF